MPNEGKSVILLSLPFAETSIPSIQLALLESYLKERNINIKTKYLYLKAADFYGLLNYNFLINSPNDSYIAQMAFSKYIFPNHWKNNIKKFQFYYNNIIDFQGEFKNKLSFENYVEKSDNFIRWAFEKIDWNPYDIIGFTLNYGQFLPSLALVKKIKENYPEKKIVFGGSTTINELGINVLKTFDYIDFIIAGEGEEALFLLASNYDNYQSIPGLIYRKNKDIIWNKNDIYADLNNLPFPNFQSYYQDLDSVSEEIKQYFSLYGRLPIELSRGCWWNKCTFCNIHSYNKKYREKTIERFIEELNFLSNTYKILTFQIIGNTLPQHNFHVFCEQLMKLERDYDFYIEARAGQLKSEDYVLLKNAGFNHIQTGIETFSSNFIKKMNKGVGIIDNIAALKYCKENSILNTYNLIADYPNEEKRDFEESKRVITLFYQYLDPPQISKFVVGYGSSIYKNLQQFNIEKLEPKITDIIMYPPEILKNNFLFFYQFKRRNKLDENNWKELVRKWIEENQQRAVEAAKRKNIVSQLIFYFIDGNSFLKIIDARFQKNVLIYSLNQIEREIFLSCINVISYNRLKDKFSNIREDELDNILNELVEAGIVFREDNNYLSLPLNYKNCLGRSSNKISLQKNISPNIYPV